MKKVICFILVFVITVCAFPLSASADEFACYAEAYVLMCANNGEVLLSDNADERLPMASTTKVMTALLTLEEAGKDNRVVTFTEEMTAEGSSMYLQVGEKVTLYDLAVGMLMQSGNDAANAAAIAIAGSIEAFADLMNKRAEKLGMENTRFVTPSGLDDDEHYSTAYDMALLLRAAMKNESFRDITSRTSMTVDFVEPSDKQVTYPNHNKLLKLYDGCIGGKTGYTSTAGRCLVSAAERDSLRLIAVTLDDGDDWNDHMDMFDYGFSHYTAVTTGRFEYTVDVVGGVRDTVRLVSRDENTVVCEREKADDVRVKSFIPPFIYAPITKEDKVGKVVYYSGKEILNELSLYPAEDIEYNSRRRGFLEFVKDILNWH